MERHAEDVASRSRIDDDRGRQPFQPISETTDWGRADGRTAPSAPEHKRGIR